MLNTLGVVQANLNSAHWCGNLARKLGGKSLLEWVVRRVTDCARLDLVVVAIDGDADGGLVRDLVPADVSVAVGSERDPLARLVALVDRFPARALVRVSAGHPFIDPALIDRLVITANEHPACDYIGYRLQNEQPAHLSALGVFAEWCRCEALRRAAREATEPADRAQETRYLYSHPEKFVTRLVPAPPQLDRDDLRLTVAHEEDWEHAEAIFEALGPEELDWQRIAGFLDHQPALRRRMAHLNRSSAPL